MKPAATGSRRGKLPGFTLVELVIFSALGAVVIGAVYLLFSASSRSGGRMEEKLVGVQSAQILLEYLRSDLLAAVVAPGKPVRVESIADGQRNRLSFERCVAPESENGPPGTRRVSYFFDPERHQVLRDGEPLLAGTFAAVSFDWQPAEEAGTAPPDVLTVTVTTAPPERLGGSEAVDPRFTCTFVETIALSSTGPRDPLRSWVPNLYAAGP